MNEKLNDIQKDLDYINERWPLPSNTTTLPPAVVMGANRGSQFPPEMWAEPFQ